MSWGARDLSVRFGDHRALQGVTLNAVPGEVRGVVGGDGAGKSTLLRALVGAIAAQGGTVSRPHAREIGYMPASSGVYPDLSVEENMEFVARTYGVPRPALRARADELLSRTGLGDARERLGGELSGGMRQKLGVLLAMLHRPRLLALDEPTTGVDPVSRGDLWWLIARAASEGAAVIVSTTYLDEAARATHLLFLEKGHALASGSPEEIVEALPGSLLQADEPPGPELTGRSWRRGSGWRVWCGPGIPAPNGERVSPDLEDAVTCALLLHEREGEESGA